MRGKNSSRKEIINKILFKTKNHRSIHSLVAALSLSCSFFLCKCSTYLYRDLSIQQTVRPQSIQKRHKLSYYRTNSSRAVARATQHPRFTFISRQFFFHEDSNRLMLSKKTIFGKVGYNILLFCSVRCCAVDCWDIDDVDRRRTSHNIGEREREESKNPYEIVIYSRHSFCSVIIIIIIYRVMSRQEMMLSQFCVSTLWHLDAIG